MKTNTIYRIIFFKKDVMYELYAHNIYQSDLYNFVEVEEILFGEKSNIVVDPNEEKLKAEFDNVERTYIPIQYILRIDELNKNNKLVSNIKNMKLSSTSFPKNDHNTFPSKK